MKKTILLLTFWLSGLFLFAQTRTELQVSELQKPIREYIAKNFKGYNTGRVLKVDARGVITYEICVNKEKTHEKLFFDKDGKFLRKESCTRECCQPPVKK